MVLFLIYGFFKFFILFYYFILFIFIYLFYFIFYVYFLFYLFLFILFYFISQRCVRVAQWIARLPPKEKAAGSNPASGIVF